MRARRHADTLGISMAALIRDALETALAEDAPHRSKDPLFRDHTVFDREAPADLSARHDAYLYEDQ